MKVWRVKIAPIGTRTRICHSRVRRSAGLSISGRDTDCMSCSVFICALRSLYSAHKSIPLQKLYLKFTMHLYKVFYYLYFVRSGERWYTSTQVERHNCSSSHSPARLSSKHTRHWLSFACTLEIIIRVETFMRVNRFKYAHKNANKICKIC